MKKYLLLALISISIISCDSEDDSTTPTVTPPQIENNGGNNGTKIIRVSSVNSTDDMITLKNYGTAEANIGAYYLCLGPGTYRKISDLTTSSTTIAANAELTLTYDVDPVADGLSVFTTNEFGSSDPSVLIDYVQWGAANQPRVGQAVTAGRWDDAAKYVMNGSPYNFTGTATEFGSDFWVGTITNNNPKVIRVSAVNSLEDKVTLKNYGTSDANVGEYFLCLGPGTYKKISTLTASSTVIAPNAELTLTYDVDPVADGLSVFTTNEFGSSDPSVLIDYVQWGAANQPRVGQAVTAGRWDDATKYVMNGSPYNFNGTATEFGSTFWAGTIVNNAIKVTMVNTTTDEVTLTNQGANTLDISGYFLCLGPGTYRQVSAITTSNTNLASGESITLPYDMNPTADGLSIFSTGTFGSSDPTILVDYVQWGAGNQPRVGQAVTAGRWDSASNFVAIGSPYIYKGNAQTVGVTFW